MDTDTLTPDGLLIRDEGNDLRPAGWVFITGMGQAIGSVHNPDACLGEHCVIHAPSDHSMRQFPTNWRSGLHFDIKGPHMERICEHGIGHPDPDDLAFWDSMGYDYSVHGCDGCCRGAYSSE